ncbi:RadC family protein [Dendrosporobacter sp. 1207_IL3150]|uniref:RadC family protein n=1 Tax=Dendrosporobacter sp. 1207_IL3150 TaxID=3084054 RepID=UPI002FDA7ED0
MKDDFQYILAECLRETSEGYTIQALLKEFSSIQDLMNASEEDMKGIKGIGAVKAKQLSAILRFVRYVQSNPSNNRIVIRSPQDVYSFVRGELEYLTVEHFMVIGLNTKNHIVFEQTISVGSLNASIVHPRETFKLLIRKACASAVVVHNHPSGDPTPSQEDIDLTKKLVQAGTIIDIPILDHLIVGQGRYVSLKEKGII